MRQLGQAGGWVADTKPHLYRVYRIWFCTGSGRISNALTPTMAYLMWQQARQNDLIPRTRIVPYIPESVIHPWPAATT